jgi:hypothetical protein
VKGKNNITYRIEHRFLSLRKAEENLLKIKSTTIVIISNPFLAYFLAIKKFASLEIAEELLYLLTFLIPLSLAYN